MTSAGFSQGSQLYSKVSRRRSCTFIYLFLLGQMLPSIESVTVQSEGLVMGVVGSVISNTCF